MSQPRSQWLVYAIASGGCAALNGVFAKLTTTKLTTTWAKGVSQFLGVDESSEVLEYIIRASFFLMNLAFNGVMWGLFTRALTLASSTVRVSVINTSANFMVTAVLGAAVFSEDLPRLWWIGAGLLVAGSVIIGRRGEEKDTGTPTDVSEKSAEGLRKKDLSKPVSATGSNSKEKRGDNDSSIRKRS